MKYIALVLVCLALSSCGVKGSSNVTINGALKLWEKVWPADNPTEEAIEEVIEDYTSLQIDISPCSPETEE